MRAVDGGGMPAYDAAQPSWRGPRARKLMCPVPAAPAGVRRAGLGACRAADGGVGVEGEGAEGVHVDYAPRCALDIERITSILMS